MSFDALMSHKVRVETKAEGGKVDVWVTAEPDLPIRLRATKPTEIQAAGAVFGERTSHSYSCREFDALIPGRSIVITAVKGDTGWDVVPSGARLLILSCNQFRGAGGVHHVEGYLSLMDSGDGAGV